MINWKTDWLIDLLIVCIYWERNTITLCWIRWSTGRSIWPGPSSTSRPINGILFSNFSFIRHIMRNILKLFWICIIIRIFRIFILYIFSLFISYYNYLIFRCGEETKLSNQVALTKSSSIWMHNLEYCTKVGFLSPRIFDENKSMKFQVMQNW